MASCLRELSISKKTSMLDMAEASCAPCSRKKGSQICSQLCFLRRSNIFTSCYVEMDSQNLRDSRLSRSTYSCSHYSTSGLVALLRHIRTFSRGYSGGSLEMSQRLTFLRRLGLLMLACRRSLHGFVLVSFDSFPVADTRYTLVADRIWSRAVRLCLWCSAET